MQGAESAGTSLEFDAGSDAIAQRGNVGYDADELAVLAQTPQRIQRNVKSLGIQSAETFVQKQGIHPDIPAGKSGKSEGEGEAYQKTFAAG